MFEHIKECLCVQKHQAGLVHSPDRGAGRVLLLPLPCLQQRARPAAVAALPWLRCHCHAMGQHEMALLLPNVSEMQIKAHGGCVGGTQCLRRHWVPAGSGQASHSVLAMGLHKARPSKVAPQPPCPRMVPWPLLALWPCPRQLPGPVMGSVSRLQHQAPLLHSGCASHIVPKPLASCQQGFSVSGQSGPDPGLPISWWQDGAVLGRRWAGLALGCLDGFACKALLAAGGTGRSSAADASVQGEWEAVLPSLGQQSLAPRSRDDCSRDLVSAGQGQRQLCSRCRGGRGAPRRGEGLLLLHPPGEGPGRDMSPPLLQVSEQAKTQVIFSLSP